MSEHEHEDLPLKQSEAEFRSAHVSKVSYALAVKLTKGDTFSGTVGIKFDYKATSENLFLDFKGTVSALKVNGKSCDEPAKAQNANRVNLASVVAGSNHVEIDFTCDYSHTGEGLHHFVDPADNETYVYTNFEPFYAHHFLPCFDQPDLRAKLDLVVVAPSDWQVIANGKTTKNTSSADGLSEHVFETTPAISTYLFALVAGPYDHVHDDFNGRVPLGIFCRKSLRKHLDSDELFEITKQGMAFYEEFFDMEFPFSKYDQLFVPEFNQGAMENVGAVTFTESYIYRDTPTQAQRLYRADTVLHEMAHMWFGNLVSPQWWNCLWLNESFATYMAALSVASATRFGPASWQEFNSGMKAWAYREDQLSTTHPIEGPVDDTDQTFLNFDGVTYGKGSAVLKQLVHLVSMDGFKTAMRYYFQKHKWGNTVIGNFLEAIEHGAKSVGVSFNPTEWSKMWLEAAGVNTLRTNLEVKDGKVAAASIEQAFPPTHCTCRSHRLQFAIFDSEASKVSLRKVVDIVVQPVAKTELPQLVGEASPAFVYPNFNDHGYAKVSLDEQSEKFGLENLEKFDDPLLRQLLWSDFYNMTRDAKMKSTAYLKLCREKITFETEPKLVQAVLSRVHAVLANFVPKALYAAEAKSLFEFGWNALQKAPAGEWQIVWAKFTVGIAADKESVEKLVQYLPEGSKVAGDFVLDQGMRWTVVQKSMGWGLPNARDLLAAEEKRDATDRGVRAALSAKSSWPDKETKAAAWERYIAKEHKKSYHMMASDMGGFRWRHQNELIAEYRDKFFDVIRTVSKTQAKEYTQSFFGSLFPSDPEDATVLEKARGLLGQLTEQDQVLIRSVKEEIDDLERSGRCMALFN